MGCCNNSMSPTGSSLAALRERNRALSNPPPPELSIDGPTPTAPIAIEIRGAGVVVHGTPVDQYSRVWVSEHVAGVLERSLFAIRVTTPTEMP